MAEQPEGDLSDPDFQPNKRPRLGLLAPLTSCGKPHVQQRDVSAGLVQCGKENLPPLPAVSDNTQPHSHTEGSSVEDNSETLPVRKPKYVAQLAVNKAAPAPLPAQQLAPAVRAFFTRRASWSLLADKSSSDTAVSKQHESDPYTCSIPRGTCRTQLCASTRNSQTASAVWLKLQPSSFKQAIADSSEAGKCAITASMSATVTSAVGQPHHEAASAAITSASLPTNAGSLPSSPAVMPCKPSDSLPGNFVVLDSSDSDADSDASDSAELAESQTQAAASQQAVTAWLQQHGLSAYITAFEQAEVDLDLIPLLHDNDLKQMGVTALGPRRKILAAAAKLAAEATKYQNTAVDQGDAVAANGGQHLQGNDSTHRQQGPGQNAFAVLMKQARQSKTATGDVEKAQEPTDALSMLMQQARGAQVSSTAEPSCSHRSHAGDKSARRGAPARLPNWQMVPGTNFVVDKFGGKAYEAAPTSKHWFLTHFHADHYGGLGPRFKQGTIYCSPITARLAQQRLKVPAKFLHVVPLHSPFQVAGVTVTFMDAHHCPGAVMILFEAPGRLPLLHTGDCRCHEGMQKEQCLQRVRGAVDLVLDTTYCNPQYIFPSQEEVLEFVLKAVKAEAFNEKRTLFLFGSYTIGKEKLFLEVARSLKQKIYVSVAKRKVLECLELPAELASLLTSNDKETNLHAVPLWSITQKGMSRLLKHYRGRYTTIVGFQPTGWTQKQDRGKAGQGRRRHKGTVITYQVPYSEHSSFPELRDFVSWLRPCQIIPSVSNDHNGPKASGMVSLLRSST